MPAVELAWMASEADLSAKSGDWLMNYDHASSSWRTCQQSLMEDWIAFSERWPSAGTMRDGYVYPQPNWARATAEIDGGFLPTPTQDGNYNRAGLSAKSGDGLATAVLKMLPTLSVNGLLGRAIHRLPTIQSRDWRSANKNYRNRPQPQNNLNDVLGGPLSPQFVEQMQDYPIGATELLPWVTQSMLFKRGKRSGG